METQQAGTARGTVLSQEDRNDLRKRVLSGKPLTLEEARQVIESCRQGSSQAIIEAGTAKPKRGKAKAKGLSDEELDVDLDNLGL